MTLTIVDLVLVGIALGFALVGLVKGFSSFFLSVVSTIASVVIAFMLSPMVAKGVYHSFVETPLTQYIEMKIDEKAEETGANVKECLPEALGKYSNVFGTDFDKLLKDITPDSGKIATAVVNKAVGPFTVKILRFFTLTLMALLLRILLRFVCLPLKKVLKIPILANADKILGFAAGAVKGILISFVAALLVFFTSPLIKEESYSSQVDNSLIINTVFSAGKN